MAPFCARMCPCQFFEATPPGAAPGPPVKTGARVRRFRGCNKTSKADFPLFKLAGGRPNGGSEGLDPWSVDPGSGPAALVLLLLPRVIAVALSWYLGCFPSAPSAVRIRLARHLGR